MTVRTKAGILLPVTLLMAVGFFLMLRKGLSVPCVILAVIWVFHVIYFAFGVKTITEAGGGRTARRRAAAAGMSALWQIAKQTPGEGCSF